MSYSTRHGPKQATTSNAKKAFMEGARDAYGEVQLQVSPKIWNYHDSSYVEGNYPELANKPMGSYMETQQALSRLTRTLSFRDAEAAMITEEVKYEADETPDRDLSRRLETITGAEETLLQNIWKGQMTEGHIDEFKKALFDPNETINLAKDEGAADNFVAQMVGIAQLQRAQHRPHGLSRGGKGATSE